MDSVFRHDSFMSAQCPPNRGCSGRGTAALRVESTESGGDAGIWLLCEVSRRRPCVKGRSLILSGSRNESQMFGSA